MRIILASASPRRKELLKQYITSFEVIPSNFDEESIKQIENNPGKLVEIISKGKGDEVYKRHPQDLIISADTIVTIDNKIIGG